MVMKIGYTVVKFCERTVVSQTGDTFVELGFTVLEILKDTWNGASFVLWCQWLKANVLESDVGTLERNLHVGDVILEVQSLWGEIKCVLMCKFIKIESSLDCGTK